MCGIAGIVDFRGQTPSVDSIESMTHELRHRGPDGEGTVIRDGVALGHRRLAIIDVAGGRQPLCNETEEIWLTFNGEIYNYRALRCELEDAGHHFRSQSDSEVIVHAYEQWGDDCVNRFRGMFAFVIADFRERRILAARDHLGIKPLFLRIERDYVAFASEISPLLLPERGRPELNCQALDYYLRYRYVPAPHTIYDRVMRLPPAHRWSCRFDGTGAATREYWRLDMEPESGGNETEWQEAFEDVLQESVSSHLVADVPFGAFLSGGVDSTLVVAAMVKQLGRTVKAFTIGFEDQAYSEIAYARQAAEVLGVELHEEIVRPNVVDILGELFTRYGEPFADTSAVPTWCVARLAREHVPMVLSGDGADEAFAGYSRYERWSRDQSWPSLQRCLRNPKAVGRRLWSAARGTQPTRLHRWQQDFVGVFDARSRLQLWRPELRSLVHVPASAFTRADRAASDLGDLPYAQYVDLKTYLPGDILTKVDVATMCHGLEARTPLTDVRVLEFAARVPVPLRQRVLRPGQVAMKPLLKDTLSKRFSSSFVHRPKRGFAIPEASWMKRGNPVRECFDDVVAHPQSPLRDYFEDRAIDQMILEFDERGTHATRLWLLMILGFWMQSRSVVQRPRVAA